MKSLIEYRVSQALASSPILQEAAIAESGITELLSLAAAEENQADRWQRYEELKQAGSGYVGWHAKKEALQNTAMYEAFTAALDELLPEPLDEDRIA